MAYPFEVTDLVDRSVAILVGASAAATGVTAWIVRSRRAQAQEQQLVWNRMLLGALIMSAGASWGRRRSSAGSNRSTRSTGSWGPSTSSIWWRTTG